MWALVYTILVIGAPKPEVYGIETFPNYVQCFNQLKAYTPQLRPNQNLNCVQIPILYK